MPRLRVFKDANHYRGLMAHFSADNWRRKRAHGLIAARECREALTNPTGIWRYSPDDPRVKEAVGKWVARAKNHHLIAMGRKPLNGTFVVMSRTGGDVAQNPYVREVGASGREAA